jgi:hypothetical protein
MRGKSRREVCEGEEADCDFDGKMATEERKI